MRIGLSLTHHSAIGGDARHTRDAVMEQITRAEDAGFDSAFFGHHYLTRSGFLQPLSLAGYVAARTERIRLGMGVYLLALHNPVAIAEELATLDVLSGGRLIAGFGSGYRDREFRAFNVPAEQRYARLEESVRVVRDLWSGQPVTCSGMFGELDGHVMHLRPVQPGGPPIWLGAFGPVGIRRAARLSDAWLAPPGGSPEELAKRRDLFDAERLAAGRPAPAEYPLLREGFVATTGRQARDTARPYLAQQYREYRGWDHGEQIDELLARNALVGDPDEVIERLQTFEKAGFDHVIIRMQWTGTPLAETLASIEMFGRHVIPAVA